MPLHSLARLTHALASGQVDGLVDADGWRAIAQSLVGLGCDWPALAELSAEVSGPEDTPDGPDDLDGLDRLDAAVARLAAQARQVRGDAAELPFWDAVCGLVGRLWRLGSCDTISAVYRLDALWWTARDFDRSSGRGLQLIWSGMTLKEVSDHADVRSDAAVLLADADRLIPADVRDVQLCEVVLDALR
ncbi:hypothetical protein [Yinghuangia soli]|uniref:Uncharacterized protein n=1 Tax=Yinghuangia soli TaxID=2908204 RepID=A0AA41Q995_9ACTN|nr:hypothetical protein [Yinghuangia soli]MCF2533617.1 hypothetical protein [Yinghuangia soli]